jgi:hypothetical protein
MDGDSHGGESERAGPPDKGFLRQDQSSDVAAPLFSAFYEKIGGAKCAADAWPADVPIRRCRASTNDPNANSDWMA